MGGQGLNLCWRDVAVLQALAARVASGRLRRQRLAAAYGWRRWPDLLLVLLFMFDLGRRPVAEAPPAEVPLAVPVPAGVNARSTI